MEIVAAAIGVSNVTARVSSKIWCLCEPWEDAPQDVYQLRDKLVSRRPILRGPALRHAALVSNHHFGVNLGGNCMFA